MRNRHHLVFRNMQSPAIIVSGDFRIEDINLNALEMLKNSCGDDSRFKGIFECGAAEDSGGADAAVPDEKILAGKPLAEVLPWMKEEIDSFRNGSDARLILEHSFGAPGNTTHLKVKITRLPDAGDTEQGAFVTITDVTAQKKMEELSSASERTILSLLNAMPEAGLLLDNEGIILAANKALSSILERNIKTILGENVFSLLPEDIVEKMLPYFNKTLDTKKHIEFSDSFRGRHFDNYLTPIGEGGDIKNWKVAVFCHDVTETKVALTQLEKRNTELSIINTISTAIVKTIDENELYEELFNSLVELEDYGIRAEGSIFLNDGGRLKLSYQKGHGCSCAEKKGIVDFGECLCGLAAEREEIIYEKHQGETPGVIPACNNTQPHGHLVLPLKAKSKLIAVLNLQLEPGAEIDDNAMSMLVTIGNHIGMAVENAQLYKQTRELSLRDPLTGLANRRLMDILFERNLSLTIRNRKPFSVIMADIDMFKEYNDTHGHTEGDSVLMEAATTLIENIRLMDLAVRYGGEEFLVLLPETDLQAAHDVAERLRKTAEDELDVTISFGVAGYSEGLTKEDMIEHADNALYRAKQNGRNRVEVYGSQGG